jgi:CheY-like chemotaxis protein
MLNSISDILEGRLTAKDLLYRTDFQDISAPCIEGCENLLKQILINILGNAIKYTDDGGMVIFKVYNERPEQNFARYHFIVKDTGIGISSEYVQHIFDRFSQEELSARSNYEGTGLGLSIVKELTDLMGGEVLVSSKVGVGSVFEVIIPFVLSDIKESIKQQSDSISDSTVTRKLHVLLADDNDTNREVAEFFLTKAGAVCVSVENGQLALDAFKRSFPGEYDAILLDVMMPELDGLETAQAIRALDRPDAQTIPMIAMSANAYAEDVEKSLTAGMNAHLTKPIRFDTVIETIQEFCQ